MAGERFFQPGRSHYVSQFVPTQLPFELMDRKIQEADIKHENFLKELGAQGLSEVDALRKVDLVGNVEGERELLMGDIAVANQLTNQFLSEKEKVFESISKGNVFKDDFASEIRKVASLKKKTDDVFGVLNDRKKSYDEAQKKLSSVKNLAEYYHVASDYNTLMKDFQQSSGSLESLMQMNQLRTAELGEPIENRIARRNQLGSQVKADYREYLSGYSGYDLVNKKFGKGGITEQKAFNAVVENYRGSELEKDNDLNTRFHAEHGNLQQAIFNKLGGRNQREFQAFIQFGLNNDLIDQEEFQKVISGEDISPSIASKLYKDILTTEDVFGVINAITHEKKTASASVDTARRKELEEEVDEDFSRREQEIFSQQEVDVTKFNLDRNLREHTSNIINTAKENPQILKSLGDAIGISIDPTNPMQFINDLQNAKSEIKYNPETLGYSIRGKDLGVITSELENNILNNNPHLSNDAKTSMVNNLNRSIGEVVKIQAFANDIKEQTSNDPDFIAKTNRDVLNLINSQGIFNLKNFSELTKVDFDITKLIDINNDKSVEKWINDNVTMKSYQESGRLLDPVTFSQKKEALIESIKSLRDNNLSNRAARIINDFNAYDQTTIFNEIKNASEIVSKVIPTIPVSSLGFNKGTEQAFVNDFVSKGLIQYLASNIQNNLDTKRFSDVLRKEITDDPSLVSLIGYNKAIVPHEVIQRAVEQSIKQGASVKEKEDVTTAILDSFITDKSKQVFSQRGSLVIDLNHNPLNERQKTKLDNRIFGSTYQHTQNIDEAIKAVHDVGNASFYDNLPYLQSTLKKLGKVGEGDFAIPNTEKAVYNIDKRTLSPTGELVKTGENITVEYRLQTRANQNPILIREVVQKNNDGSKTNYKNTYPVDPASTNLYEQISILNNEIITGN